MEEEMIVLEMTEVESKFIYDLLYFVDIDTFCSERNKRLRKRYEAACDIHRVLGEQLNFPKINHKDFCMVGYHNKKTKNILLIDREYAVYEEGQ
jgi:hypothetical protein